MRAAELPLAGVLVLDFSQFLAGPVAALRLADLGARVVKVERPVTGEIGRTLAFAGCWADEDTVSFHAMNRNKEAVVADLKDPGDLEQVKRLVERADVLIHNFRPGVMERIGLHYDAVRAMNPGIVYAAASGYGADGPWSGRPGQDLLAQSVSGLTWANGTDRPVTVGLSLADHLLSCHLARGVTALLVRKARTGRGGLIESSLLEAMLDLQTEPLTAKLNPRRSAEPTQLTELSEPPQPSSPQPSQRPQPSSPQPPQPSSPQPSSSLSPQAQHPSRPLASLETEMQGIYRTADGYVAIALTAVSQLARVVGAGAVASAVADRLMEAGTAHWIDVLRARGIECAPLRTLDELLASPEFAAVDMTQTVERPPAVPGGVPLRLTTTRSPIRIDGVPLRNRRAAPRLGAQGHVGAAGGSIGRADQ